MAVYTRPSLTMLSTTTVTTVTSVSINENHSTGSFAGDNDSYAMGWAGAGTVNASIQMADINQAKSLVDTEYSYLAVTHAAAGGGTDEITTLSDVKVVSIGLTNPFDANSGCTVGIAYVGAGGTTSPIVG